MKLLTLKFLNHLLITSIFLVVSTLMPIQYLAAQESTDTIARDNYRDAIGEYGDSVSTDGPARHGDNLEYGQLVDGETDSNASGQGGEGAYIADIVYSLVVFIATAWVSILFVIMHCTNQPSPWIMFVGALVYFAGEIANWAGYDSTTSAMNERIVALTGVTQAGKDIQVEAINELVNLHKAAKEHTEVRLVLQVITMVIYLIAAIVALIEGILKQIPAANYNDSCSGGTGSLQFNNDSSKIAKSDLSLETLANSLLNIFFPEAHAYSQDVFTYIGMGAVLIVFVILTATSFDSVFNAVKQSGFARAVLYAVIVALTVVSVVQTEERLQLLNRRIAALEDLKDKIEVGLIVPGSSLGATLSNAGIGTGGNPLAAGAAIGEANPLSGNCINPTEIGNPATLAPTNCSSCSGDSCGLNLEQISTDSLVGVEIPSNVLTSLEMAKNGAKDLTNGRGLSKDLRGMGTSGGLMAMRKSLDDVLNNGNKLLKSQGKPEFNLVAEMQEKKKEIKAIMQKNYASLTPQQKSQLASELSGNLLSDKAQESLKKANKEIIPELQLPIFAPPKTTMPKINLSAGSNNQNKIDTPSSADELKGLKFDTQDIVKESGVPIWTVISNRYRKSAFRHFFTEDRAKTKE